MEPQRKRSRKFKEEINSSQEQDDRRKLTTVDLVIDLLNKASMSVEDSVKVERLQQVKELVINKQPEMLDNFTDEVVAFQADRSQEVRKFVVGFMEEACKKDPELFSKLLLNLHMLLVDENVNVLKKVIQSSTQLYRICVQWISTHKNISNMLKSSWKTMCDIQQRIFELFDSENDGVRTQVVKFAEKVILTLSEKHRLSELPKKLEVFSSLDQLPNNHTILVKSELKSLGVSLLEKLLSFVASPAISSVNLMASMGTLTTIAKQRPQFISTVVPAFETLHANLPPTLAKTQVTSVRKHLKMQLLNLLRHPASIEFHPQITNLLYDLGTNSSEIAKNMPNVNAAMRDKKSASKKRTTDEIKGAEMSQNKKAKVEDDYNEYGEEDVGKPDVGKVPEASGSRSIQQHNTAIDMTASELVPLLSPENVANLVLLSMVMLPDKIPDAFQASYTPIESAGTIDQKKHLARLLSIQMTAVGIGSGVQHTAEMEAKEIAKKQMEKEKKELEKKIPIQTLIGGTTTSDVPEPVEVKQESKPLEPTQPAVPMKGMQRRIQGFHLASITKPLSLEAKDKIIKMAVLRVLKSERSAIAGGIHSRWQKILTNLVAQFGGDLHRSLAKFILADIRNRSQLAFQWLYEEFNIYLENARGINDKAAMENYDACLTGLLQGLLEKQDSREGLFTKLVLQAPLLTDSAIKVVHSYCEDERRSQTTMLLVRTLLSHRPTRRMQFLRVLLDLSTFKIETVRQNSIEIVKELYENQKYRDFIEQYAMTNLSYLKEAEPPNDIRQEESDKTWNEEQMKQCFQLCLSLLPTNHALVHNLAAVYVEASANIKRVILHSLDAPVHGVGMSSPELLKLVEECPKGAETIVTRMLHILTDREHPSPSLVCKVRDLYQKRVPDVRFLIPVINGLEKYEVLAVLPKLIKLNPTVVKGVFNRLLGIQRHYSSEPSVSAITPVELLVALHTIDQSKADVKFVIKATSLCFAEKAVYTSEVLVTVINHLVELPVIPTLLMRTVIQALITYSRLSGFVMNVLQRLIMKRVWEQTKVWEGFIRCCQRMKPQSFQVLLQLPPAWLSNVFETFPDLREPLLQYVNKLTPQQRQHISPAIVSVLEVSPEQAALKAQREMQEKLARSKEQEKLAQEWERKERDRKAALQAQQEIMRINAQLAKQESERQKRNQEASLDVKVETNKEGDGLLGAFPGSNPQPSLLGPPPTNATPLLNPPMQVQADIKPVILPASSTPPVSTNPPALNTTASPAKAITPTPLPPATHLPPPGIILPPNLPLPPFQYNVPPPTLMVAPPAAIPPSSTSNQSPAQAEVKTERSATPTQDESDDVN
uniref:symplekin n=1 Tax=Ciona intestinalis TaxID=7719 RepID=UPI000521866C|nr:symplekin [Ciona intestinalis]|eukprot:XP_009860228.1 symplekin [Ciona intestinalis]